MALNGPIYKSCSQGLMWGQRGALRGYPGTAATSHNAQRRPRMVVIPIYCPIYPTYILYLYPTYT